MTAAGDDPRQEVERAFGATTLAEVLADPSPSVPLCPFPSVKPKTRRAARAAE